jgi:hypothetical protein
MQCRRKKRDGSDCRARALIGKEYCALHADPGRAAEIGRKGGRRRTNYAPDRLKDFAAPKDAADLRDLLAQSIVEIRAGVLDSKLANAISYLGMGFLRAVELADLEKRLVELERQNGISDGNG